MNNQDIAKKVIEALGGRENVNSVAHCATRLRVMVKDEGKINKEVIENLDKVQGAFFNSGQYQIIFGTGTVNKMYDEVVALGLPTSSKEDMKAEAAKQGNWFQRAIRTFGDVFVPLLPAIVATGLFMGIRGAIVQDQVLALFGTTAEAFKATNFYTYSVVLTDTAFAFFPALICWSAFRVFGGNPLLGLVLGLMMVNSSLPNAWAVASGDAQPIIFFGFIKVVGYQNSVLPAFFVGLTGAKLEKWLRKRIPDVLDLLLVPFLTFLVMSILALFVIGPVFHEVESYVKVATVWLLSLPMGLGGLILGGVHQVIVVTGVHHIFNLLESNLVTSTGSDPLNAIITAAMMGLIAGAAGGWLANILGLAGTSFGITIIPGTLLYINGQLLQYIFMVLVTTALGFGLTYAFGYKEETEVAEETVSEEATEANEEISVAPQNETIQTPIVGDVVALENVNDPVFSSGAMGQGIAVKPSQGVVYAPADAEVSIAFATGHAYGLKTANGAEILIHVGIDTVTMNGEGFEQKVAQGDKVKAGDVLGTFDSNKIAAAGLDDTTMVIVTNTADYASVTPVASGSVVKGDAIIEVKA